MDTGVQMPIRAWPDWFTGGYAEQYFEKHLMRYIGVPDLRFLQIGAYAGDASVWLLDNVLTGTGSTLRDVDTWEGSQETAHSGIDFAEVHEYYRARVQDRPVWSYRMTSDAFFVRQSSFFEYDFIYIDRAHTPDQVMRDAVNADRWLKRGGLLAFDDYLWHEADDVARQRCPGPAIDAFIRCFGTRYVVVEMGLQVWLEKTG